ncbi:MAG: hypothetical protein SchgKO_14830 [Schleiferiaceae bacterium]
MRRNWYSLFLLFAFHFSAQAGEWVDSTQWVNVTAELMVLEDTSTQMTPEEVYYAYADNQFHDPKGFVNFGFSKSAVWLALPLRNQSGKDLDGILEVANHSLDFVDFFRLDGERLVLLEQTGDFIPRENWKTQFPTPSTRIFLFDADSAVFFVRVFKPTGAMSTPVYLWDRKARVSNAQRGNLYTGIFSGITLLLCLYTLLLFAQFKQKIYLYYALYILSMTVYLWAGTGFTEFWFWPKNILVQNSITAVASAFVFVFLSTFSMEYLKLKWKHFQGKLAWISVWIIAVLIVANYIFPSFFSQKASSILVFFYALVVIQQINFLVAGITRFSSDRRYYGFFIAAYIIPYLGVLSKVLIEIGYLPDFTRKFNPVLFGFGVDIVIFAMALTYQLRNIYRDRQRLLEQQVSQAKELIEARVRGEENEKKRIAQELHDDVGYKLSKLKRDIEESQAGEAVVDQVTDVISHTREITHTLYPGSLKFLGIKRAIVNLVDEIRQSYDFEIRLEFYDFPDKLPTSHDLHVYRMVQEGFNNIIKYAECTKVSLELFKHDSGYVITLEDNGKGFDLNSITFGVGLDGIQSRVDILGGRLVIDSSPGRGTTLLIELPLADHED